MTTYKITRANAKTLEEWIALYKQKTKDVVSIPEGFVLNFIEDRGLAIMKAVPQSKLLIIYDLCGDAKFWRDMAEVGAKQNGLRYISTICTRSIEPYIRFWHWKIQTKSVINGQARYICLDERQRYVVITHKGINEVTGKPDYWVTQYLVKGEKPVFSHSDKESE